LAQFQSVPVLKMSFFQLYEPVESPPQRLTPAICMESSLFSATP
jgi:hypothetical protein